MKKLMHFALAITTVANEENYANQIFDLKVKLRDQHFEIETLKFKLFLQEEMYRNLESFAKELIRL